MKPLFKKIWLIVAGLALCQAVFSQQVFEPVKVLAGNYIDFDADNLGNIYLIAKDQQIKKINAQYDSVVVFNEVRNFGPLFAIDVSNPLRVILWYKDFATLLILDRFLNRRTIIDMRRIGILQCSAVAQSFDNNIWLFDELDNKIKKINEAGELLLESADFRILFDDPPHPFKMEDFNKQLYAYDSTRGLVVLDYFGAYKQVFSYKGWRSIQGFEKGLLAADEQSLIYLPPDGINTTSVKLPESLLPYKKIRVQLRLCYVLGIDGVLRIYKLPDNITPR
jgi:hypothetical protein